ncbi:MAG: sugar nucleotide-binding protein, partial [Blastocatellia bacterium]
MTLIVEIATVKVIYQKFMRVLVFGGGGMLGHKLVQVLAEGFDVWATFHGDFKSFERFGIFDESRSIPNVEVTDAESVRKAIATAKPDVVINAVGIIKQLPTSKEVVTTLKINSLFPHFLVELSGEFNFRMITVSTDCVFNGEKGNYIEDDTPDALDLYGQSKHFGEV